MQPATPLSLSLIVTAVALLLPMLAFGVIMLATRSHHRLSAAISIGAAGLSSFPMSARLVQQLGREEDKGNFSLENSEVEGVRLAYEAENGGRYVITVRAAEGEVVFTLPYDRYYRDLLFRQFEGRVTW